MRKMEMHSGGFEVRSKARPKRRRFGLLKKKSKKEIGTLRMGIEERAWDVKTTSFQMRTLGFCRRRRYCLLAEETTVSFVETVEEQ